MDGTDELDDYIRQASQRLPKTSGNTSQTGWWTPDRINQAVDHLQRNAKLSPMGAKGLVARWVGVEAGGGPNSVNPTSGATGIAQWLGTRKSGVPSDFVGQLNYATKELNSREAQAARQLRRAQTPEDAAIGAAMYERAEGYDKNNPYAGDKWVGKTIQTLHQINGTQGGYESLDNYIKNQSQPAPSGSIDDYIKEQAGLVGSVSDIPTGTRPAPTNPTQTIPQSSTANIVPETPDALLQRLDQPLEAPNVGLTGPGVTTPLPIQRKGQKRIVPQATAQLPQARTTEPTISEQNYDEKTGQPIDAQGNIIPQTNLQGVQVSRNDAGEAGEPIDIPENIKTANEANAYVRQYLQAKYPDGDFSKGQFLTGYTPGQGAFVDFATLKRAGVDTDALISQKIAEKRGSTESVPDLSVKANMPEMDAQGIKDFLGSHPYLFGAWSSGKGQDALSQAIGSALNAGGNTANALAGAIRVIGQLNPARMDSMAEAVGLKPYRSGDDVVKYLKDIANTTSQFAEASGGKYQDVAGASDKGSLEGRPVQRKTLASEVGSAIGGLADVPRLSLYPGGPIVAFAADNALQTAAQGDEADWGNVLKAAGKGGALGAATLVAPGVGKLAEKLGAGTLLAKGLELGSVAPAVGLTSLALGDSPSEAFKNAILFTGFHLYGMAKDRIVNTPIRVADERGNEAVIEVNKDGDVKTLDPKTDAQVQVRIPEQTYTEAEKTPIAKPTEPLPTAEKPVEPVAEKPVETPEQPKVEAKAETPKVVTDEQGRPQEFFHGTNTPFDEFDAAYAGKNLGFHFGTEDQSQTIFGGEPPKYVHRAHLTATHPLRLEDLGSWYGRDVVKMINDKIGSHLSPSASYGSIRRAIQDAGYDSVVYKNRFEGDPDNPQDSYIVFDKNQIHRIDAPTKPTPEQTAETGANVQPVVEGKVGPHEGREIDMVANGEKPVALFGTDLIKRVGYNKQIKDRGLATAEFENKQSGFSNTVVARTQAEADAAAKQLEELHNTKNTADVDHATVGRILGYSDADIKAFERANPALKEQPRSNVKAPKTAAEAKVAETVQNSAGQTGTLEKMPNGTQRVRIRPAKGDNPMDGTTVYSPARWKPVESKPSIVKTAAEQKALPPELAPFAKNKILTVDKVAAARERLKGKETQFNAGLDPETLKDLAIIGGAHIEAGVRSAAELAKVMAKDFGEGIKKHIDEIYAQIHKDYGDKFAGMEPPVTEVKPIIGKGVVEPPTETVKPPEPERGTSKIGKSIEQKAIDDGLTEGFPETAGYDKKHVEDQKARIGKLIENDYDAARRMVTGTQRVPPDISPIMLIRGMEEVAKVRNDPELRYELANSPIVSESSIHAQEMRMMQEREPDSANAALQALRKERSNQVQKVLRGRTVEQAIKEEAEKLAQTLRPTMERAKRALKTKEVWTSFIDSIQC